MKIVRFIFRRIRQIVCFHRLVEINSHQCECSKCGILWTSSMMGGWYDYSGIDDEDNA